MWFLAENIFFILTLKTHQFLPLLLSAIFFIWAAKHSSLAIYFYSSLYLSICLFVSFFLSSCLFSVFCCLFNVVFLSSSCLSFFCLVCLFVFDLLDLFYYVCLSFPLLHSSLSFQSSTHHYLQTSLASSRDLQVVDSNFWGSLNGVKMQIVLPSNYRRKFVTQIFSNIRFLQYLFLKQILFIWKSYFFRWQFEGWTIWK